MASTDEFTERVIVASRLGYVSKGREVVIWKDIDTGEEFHMYAKDILAMMGCRGFLVKAKVINRRGGYDSKRALRIMENG